MMKRLAGIAGALLSATQALAQVPIVAAPIQLGSSPIEAVVAAMTVEEKARLLVGMGIRIEFPGLPALDPEDLKIPEKVAGAAGQTHAIPRLGIPSIALSDGPAGVRIDATRKNDTATYYAVAFPVETLLASTWDTDLIRKVGATFGSEAREFGADILLAPALNIQRNPLGGRNFEYYSEDPLVSGKMAAAFVQGVQSNGVGTSIKHFAVNSQEYNRMQSNSIVGERALREIYLKGFEIAVKESQPWTVMSSYNLLNGTYTSQSRELLTTILRDEWGFKGLVMSDWWAGNDPLAQIIAGNDLLMPGNPGQTKAVVDGVASGALSARDLDESVKRVLQLIVQSPSFKGYKYSSHPDLKADAQVSRAAAVDGMVLLKNDGNTLPLAAGHRIALYGNAGYDLIPGGTGSGDVKKAYVTSPAQGLRAAGFVLDEALGKAYVAHIAEQKAKRPKLAFSFFLPPPLPELSLLQGDLARHASESDAAVFVLGRNSGEFSDRAVENDFALTALEKELLRSTAAAFHAKGKKVVVVMNVGGVTETASWRDSVDAILLAWQPGQEGGDAIADVLSGKVNPSGKLPMTFPMRYEDVPSAKTFPGREVVGQKPYLTNPFGGKPAEASYDEGLYVGYRYYSSFGVKPAYEFGYGLSYTDFSYRSLKLSSEQFSGKMTVAVAVTNTGKVPGREVVQLYLSAPASKLDKPDSELKGFAKTRLLQPGESQTVEFTLTPNELASFDPSISSWIADAGTYTVKIGGSSLNIKQAATFTLDREVVVQKANRVLRPTTTIDELQRKKQ